MKFLKTLSIGVTLLGASLAFGSSLQAQTPFFKTTKVSFSGPVEIPGKILPAGDYTIQVAPGDMNGVILIRDKDGNNIATLLTIADYRLNPTSDTVLLFHERAAGAPQALRAWFYPGENFGHEFVYRMKEAGELAAANQVNVPAVADNTADNDLGSAKVTEETPSGSQEAVATTETPAPAMQQQTSTPPATYSQNTTTNNYSSANNTTPADNNLQASNQPLPKTASPVFSIALLGGMFIGTGFALGFSGRRRSQGQLV